MIERDLLTEDEVIQGVTNYLQHKGRTSQKRLVNKSSAEKKEHGVDLIFKLENERKNGNWYFIYFCWFGFSKTCVSSKYLMYSSFSVSRLAFIAFTRSS